MPKQRQFCVRLGAKPTKSNGAYAVYRLSKSELGDVLKRWKTSSWEGVFAKTTGRKPTTSYHPTAIARKTAPAPLRAVPPAKGCQRALYHGVGRDRPGLAALRRRCAAVQAHDPHHPDPEVRRVPQGQYDEVYSVYTLNVLDKAESRRVLRQIHKRLKRGGYATIAVRRDTCRR